MFKIHNIYNYKTRKKKAIAEEEGDAGEEGNAGEEGKCEEEGNTEEEEKYEEEGNAEEDKGKSSPPTYFSKDPFEQGFFFKNGQHDELTEPKR